LEKFVLAVAQYSIIDSARVHFTETEFTALSNETMRVLAVTQVQLLFIFVTRRRAVDDDCRAVDRFERVVLGFHAHRAEAVDLVDVDRQLGAFVFQS
jgi:hypothetical protein